MRIPPEDMLLRWFNYHLKNAGHDQAIHNFDNDVKDSVKYTHLLNQLNTEIDKAGLDESDLVKRAGIVLDNSVKIQVPSLITPEDINAVFNLLILGKYKIKPPFHGCNLQ